MSGDGYGHGKLGANQGFGLLTDDDDDASGGGMVPYVFNVICYSDSGSVAAGATFTMHANPTSSGGAQADGVFTLVTSFYNSDGSVVISDIVTTALAGWTETGWSNPSPPHYAIPPLYWTNTFTKASVADNTNDVLSFTATAGPDTGTAEGTTTGSIGSLTWPKPQTDQAQGSGSLFSVIVT